MNQICSKQTSSTGTLGSTPERTQLGVLARYSFSTKHQFKHTSLQKDQLCTDTFVCVLNKTLARSKLQKVFLNAGREDMPHSLSEVQERHYFLPLAARERFIFQRIGYINQFCSFCSLLTPGDVAISPRQEKLDIAGGCTATSPYITSKKL